MKRPKGNFILIPLEYLKYLYENYSPADCLIYLFTQWNLNKWGMSGDHANYDVKRFLKNLYTKETIRQSFRRLARIGAIIYRYDVLKILGRHKFLLRRLVSALGVVKKIPPKDLCYLKNNTLNDNSKDFSSFNGSDQEIHGPNSPPSLNKFERKVSNAVKRLGIQFLDVKLFSKFLEYQTKRHSWIKDVIAIFVTNFKAPKLKHNQPNLIETYLHYVERQIEYCASYKWTEQKEKYQQQLHRLQGNIPMKERWPAFDGNTQVTTHIPTSTSRPKQYGYQYSSTPQETKKPSGEFAKAELDKILKWSDNLFKNDENKWFELNDKAMDILNTKGYKHYDNEYQNKHEYQVGLIMMQLERMNEHFRREGDLTSNLF